MNRTVSRCEAETLQTTIQGRLAAIYEEFFPKVLKFMHYRVGSSEAEDLASDVFIKVIRHISCQRGSLKGWIYQIARNVANDFLKSARKRHEIVVDPQDQQELLAGKVTEPETGVRLDIQRALAKLTDEQREFITMKFITGFSNQEIEQITGRRPEAIRALQFRALKALRKILDERSDCT